MNTTEVDKLAKEIWDYHHLHHKLKKADCILVLGSHDLRVAKYAAELFLKGYGNWLVFSGGIAHSKDLLKTSWNVSEAEMFANEAIKLGVNRAKILLEDKATNTGENITFTQRLLKSRDITPKSILLVQKPYMERRAYAVFKKQWLRMKFSVSSPPITFEKYPTKEIKKEDVINIMVGDLQRIMEYPKKGYAIKQRVPKNISQAFKKLVGSGYNKHLIKE